MKLLDRSEEAKAAKAAKAEQKAAQAAAEAKQREWAAWYATPQGQARAAAERGDRLLQVTFDVHTQAGTIHWGAIASTPQLKLIGQRPDRDPERDRNRGLGAGVGELHVRPDPGAVP